MSIKQGHVFIAMVCAALALVGCNQTPAGANHVILDPSADWSPSSDWAAAGDREQADGGTVDDGYPSADAACDSWASPEVMDDPPHDPSADIPGDPEEEDVDEEDADEEEEDDGDAREDAADDAGGSGGSPYVLYLSADDSNSVASPIIARKFINEGSVVDWSTVRVHEFLNYYDIGYAPADRGELNVVSQFRAVDYRAGIYALQLGVQSHVEMAWSRRPVNLTLVLDTSGSMSGSPIELLREVVRAIAASLKDGDVVSMVEWDTERSIHLSGHHVTGPDDPILLAEVASLVSGGGTNLSAGLEVGYRLARENVSQESMNRVILVSDGQANAGVTDEDIIAGNAAASEGEGIYLVGVGVGNGYNDRLMDTVTDAGRGAYIFIDTREEAHRMFEDRFIQSIEVAAYDVRVRLTLPGVFRIEEYHGEEYSEIAKEVTPQHLAPNDAMIFHQLLAASRPDRVYADDVIRVQVTWKRSPDGADATVGISNTLQRLIDTPCPEMRKADAIVVYAQALMRISAAYDRHELSEASSTCYDALHIVGAAASALDDDELREIEDLLTLYCARF